MFLLYPGLVLKNSLTIWSALTCRRVNFFSLVLQDKDTYGGSFLYHLNEDSPLVAVGFVVSVC